jgi:hypothetical protein
MKPTTISGVVIRDSKSRREEGRMVGDKDGGFITTLILVCDPSLAHSLTLTHSLSLHGCECSRYGGGGVWIDRERVGQPRALIHMDIHNE